ncbi:hypothetical protein PIB30_050300 [Stylosanthes scabra]|uniref:Uncharacterized protein n=1 Tax=Stylosanthes scabra TaxID=79078 RepID=A0ABU6ZGB4_9FABA|nr:hypothetical protein [Stylosanthes scabra]
MPIKLLKNREAVMEGFPQKQFHLVRNFKFPKLHPVGKDISAVGLCSLRNGILEIKSCLLLKVLLPVKVLFLDVLFKMMSNLDLTRMTSKSMKNRKPKNFKFAA